MDFFSLFPAHAGVILIRKPEDEHYETFPRIRGGDPVDARGGVDGDAFSPHTRG